MRPNPSIEVLATAAEPSAEEPTPLADFFDECNKHFDHLTAKILAHAEALPAPVVQADDPESIKTSASIIRCLECATRALKRAQDARIAQEKILTPPSNRQKKEEAEPHEDYEAAKREYIADIQHAREWRRIARAHQTGVPPFPVPVCHEVLPAPHAPSLEPDAPETAGDIPGLPAAPMQCAEPATDQGVSTVTDLWTPGQPALAQAGGDSPQNSSQINPQEPDSADSQPSLPAGEIHNLDIGDHETSAPAPSQPEERDPAQRAAEIRLLARA